MKTVLSGNGAPRTIGRVKFNSFAPVPGFSVAGVHAGLKKNNILDMAMFLSDRPCTAGALFTTNVFAAPPVIYDKQLIAKYSKSIRGVVINTRIANACTGEEGFRNARAFAEMAEGSLGLGANSMLCMSTGVIGAQLPLDKLDKGVTMLSESLSTSSEGWTRAASGMLTTDTRPKHAHIQGEGYVLGGCIKGAGMINPNMATMLSVLCTDAAVTPQCLQSALSYAASKSFNACTIDGDTSTNDTVVVLSNGASGVKIDREDSKLYTDFRNNLAEVCQVLAVEMIRDGEGVTKLVTVRVVNAPSEAQAQSVCKTIAHSMLVKTALFGGDANWGRIMAAVGRSGIPVDTQNCSLHVGNIRVFQNGRPEPLLSERDLTDVMKKSDITLTVSLGTGTSSGQVFTCDLSTDYVNLNADYRS